MKNKRTAFLCNMNNNAFALVRYLRDRGHDVDLLQFDNEFDHFRPEADSFDLSFRKYTKLLDWGSDDHFIATSGSKIKQDLASYDVLCGAGNAAAYCYKAGIPLDIFIPYGGDLFQTRLKFVGNPFWLRKFIPVVLNQRKGFMDIKIWHLDVMVEEYEQIFRKYGKGQRWTKSVPIVYLPEYYKYPLSEMQNRTHWGKFFEDIRQANDFMVVSHMRHVWGGPTTPSTKGNDKLLRAWAAFLKKNPTLSATLVLIEYGPHVSKSKKLIEELGIKDNIVWMPRMMRKDIMVGLFYADIVCGEFVNSWLTGGVTFEGLVVGKPILGYRNDASYPNRILYPMMNSFTEEEITNSFEQYLDNKHAFVEMGIEGRKWYEEQVVAPVIDQYSSYILNK